MWWVRVWCRRSVVEWFRRPSWARSFEVVRSRGSSAGSETKSKVLVVSTLNAADTPVMLLVTVKSVDDPDAVIVGNHPVRRTFEIED